MLPTDLAVPMHHEGQHTLAAGPGGDEECDGISQTLGFVGEQGGAECKQLAKCSL